MRENFFLLAEKLSPLFVYVLAGVLASRWLKINRDSIAKLVIYFISPIVFFETLIRSPFHAKLFALPFVFASLCSITALLIYFFSGRFFKSPLKNLLSYAGGSANTGYFGFPATAILLGEDKIATAVFIIIGYNLYECTTGFYLAARGNFESREAVAKVLRLPSLWTFLVSLVVSSLGFHHLPTNFEPIIMGFRGAYMCLGLMMIGLGLGRVREFHLHWKFVSSTLLLKLLLFPTITVTYLVTDHFTLGLLDHELQKIFLLMALVPTAANGVSIATELRLPTDEIAFTIVTSTTLALLWIPFAWSTWVPSLLNFLSTP